MSRSVSWSFSQSVTQSGRQSVGWSFIRSVCQSACQQVVLISWFCHTGIRRKTKAGLWKSRILWNIWEWCKYLPFYGNENQPILSVGSKRQLWNSLRWPIYVINSVDNTRVLRSCSLLLAGSKEVMIFNIFCLISFLLLQETRQLIFPTLIKVWFLIIPQIISLFAEWLWHNYNQDIENIVIIENQHRLQFLGDWKYWDIPFFERHMSEFSNNFFKAFSLFLFVF